MLFQACLILADTAATFFILTTFWCIQGVDLEFGNLHIKVQGDSDGCFRWAFVAVVALYPLAIAIAPALGFTFVIFPLSGVGRQYGAWNLLAIINATLVSFRVVAVAVVFFFNS